MGDIKRLHSHTFSVSTSERTFTIGAHSTKLMQKDSKPLSDTFYYVFFSITYASRAYFIRGTNNVRSSVGWTPSSRRTQFESSLAGQSSRTATESHGLTTLLTLHLRSLRTRFLARRRAKTSEIMTPSLGSGGGGIYQTVVGPCTMHWPMAGASIWSAGGCGSGRRGSRTDGRVAGKEPRDVVKCPTRAPTRNICRLSRGGATSPGASAGN